VSRKAVSHKVVSHKVVIVDTNIIVAGLLTKNDGSPVARILDGMLSAAFVFVLSEALLAEYRAVLVRPHLRKQHGLSVAEIETLLVDLAQHAIVLKPAVAALAVRAPDPGAQLLWNLLATRADLVLVTGDKLLLKDPGMQGRVLAPQDFVASF
jgi:uncharacterized protein